MPRPRTVSDETILRAAAAVVGEVGPDGLTLRAIAALADLSPSGLIQRFGSKRGLLLAVAESAPAALRRRIDRIPSPSEKPLDELLDFLVDISAGFGASPRAAANHLSFLRMDLEDPEFRAHAVDHQRAMVEGIRDLLSEAVDAGHLRAVDIDGLARTVLVTYSGALIRWAIARDGPLEHAMRRDVAAVLDPYRP